MAKGVAWSPEENLRLARAWVHVSHDAVVGNNQSSAVFFGRVGRAFKKLWEDQDENERGPFVVRSDCSLINRWKTVQADVNKFIGVYNTSISVEKSGYVVEDYERDALAMYKNADSSNKSFEYLEVWTYLKDHVPKFESMLAQESGKPVKHQRAPNADDEFDDVTQSRPRGSKAAKDAALIDKKTDDTKLSMLVEAKRRNDLIQQQNELAQRHMDQQIELARSQQELELFRDCNDATAAEYFAIKRRLALTVLKERVQATKNRSQASIDEEIV
ncbi:hypothetical protein AC1031_016347 [Aphanomyces cochlioides]|nr:hypothetical protein AC1031_016347 [Aphanomyces cochlioides]